MRTYLVKVDEEVALLDQQVSEHNERIFVGCELEQRKRLVCHDRPAHLVPRVPLEDQVGNGDHPLVLTQEEGANSYAKPDIGVLGRRFVQAVSQHKDPDRDHAPLPRPCPRLQIPDSAQTPTPELQDMSSRSCKYLERDFLLPQCL